MSTSATPPRYRRRGKAGPLHRPHGKTLVPAEHTLVLFVERSVESGHDALTRFFTVLAFVFETNEFGAVERHYRHCKEIRCEDRYHDAPAPAE